MKFLTREEVFERMRHEGHTIFENDSRNFNLNIIGIRSRTAKLDSFGCQLMVCWKYQGVWNERSYRITTFPGRYYLTQKLLNPAGCAILVPGQYKRVYSVRLHNNKYKALCQTFGNVKVFRDKDKDDQFDLDVNRIVSGEYGINIHNSPDNMTTTRVGAYSAGCQVFSDDLEFNQFMGILFEALKIYENKFTYTLITE